MMLAEGGVDVESLCAETLEKDERVIGVWRATCRGLAAPGHAYFSRCVFLSVSVPGGEHQCD